MKTFIYKTTFKPTKYGSNVTNTVYHIKKNQPIYVGETTYNTGGYRGHDHEAMHVIVKAGLLPKSCLDGSKTGYINYAKANKVFKLHQF